MCREGEQQNLVFENEIKNQNLQKIEIILTKLERKDIEGVIDQMKPTRTESYFSTLEYCRINNNNKL